MGVNASREARRRAVSINLRAQLPQVETHDPNALEVAIVAGGPSLAQELPVLKELKAETDCKIVAMNGTHDYLLDNGITPSGFVMLDARPFNVRFVQRPVTAPNGGCTYFLASQVHPDVTAALRDAPRVYQFHCDDADTRDLISRWFFGAVHIMPGGSTVALRTMVLMRLLGYMRFHVFGMDSCYLLKAAVKDEDLADSSPGGISRTTEHLHHHAYDQPENDRERLIEVDVDGETFICTPWMISQAEDFVRMVVALKDQIAVKIYGDGMIGQLLTAAAALNQGEADGKDPGEEAQPGPGAAAEPAQGDRPLEGADPAEDGGL